MNLFDNDRELLDAFRAGEKAALERVYYACVDRVFDLVRYGFLLGGGKRVPGVADAMAQREAIHDVFVKAFAEKARLGYDGLRPYQPYLLRIAKNVLIDRFRRRGHVISIEEANAELPDESPASSGDAVDDLHWRELKSVTAAWTQSLDEELRRFIEHRFVDDLPQRDVATRMGITRRRVRTLEARALDYLRKHLRTLGFI